jgi:hypothetical protein
MWKEDKRIIIGLFGGLLSLILFIISCFAIGDKASLICIFLLCATAFFLGYFFKGIKLGTILFVGLIVILFSAFYLAISIIILIIMVMFQTITENFLVRFLYLY